MLVSSGQREQDDGEMRPIHHCACEHAFYNLYVSPLPIFLETF
jgi:hypothetical protein